MSSLSVPNKDPKKIGLGLFGEAMIELSGQPLEQKYGGDTLNAAIYFSRLGHSQRNKTSTFDVYFISALGTDNLSDHLMAEWKSEGINTSLVARIADKKPGLYLVESLARGQSRFHYWRGESAARHYFQQSLSPLQTCLLNGSLNYLYLSTISLAILTPKNRTELMNILTQFTQSGGRIIFDNNYRPSLWSTNDEARACYIDILPLSDIVFLTDTDEKLMFGSDDPATIVERCVTLGIKEAVIRRGEQPCIVLEGTKTTEVAAIKVDCVVDTCAAGDSFAAAYLFSRFSGSTAQDAAKAGHQLAAEVIQHAGAIIPKHAHQGDLYGL